MNLVKIEDILPMGFLNMSDFSGSCGGLRYRLEKKTESSESDSGETVKTDKLLCTIWPGPFNFITTADELKESATFSFDEDGVCDAVSWMNDKIAADPEKWEKAAQDWESYKAD